MTDDIRLGKRSALRVVFCYTWITLMHDLPAALSVLKMMKGGRFSFFVWTPLPTLKFGNVRDIVTEREIWHSGSV
ncbi:MAG TPA: hypothetical protein PLH67_13575, partial [Lentisphaeria bacterium]|nr:hypothetical protein [Lentisphaeria bacterium]